ncbi:MAG: quinone-dependent dihydroorotate dehydrogenase [Propionibacteriaceae bacterium]|jgi:dihydroorotate dehydrogenase|nr:quinone-dependent dihydroorotate dehydrogenase [Propionibacteriaceae bacterium]
MNETWLRLAYERLIRPALFSAYGGDPEKVHEAMISLLGQVSESRAKGLVKFLVGGARSPVRIAGVDFPGRVGVAAGLDKDGTAARIWSSLGFGFAELGTVTAQAQAGNPRPRVFRLRRSRALINRMGFNNAGAGELADRLTSWGVRRGERSLGIPLGISIGKTKVVDLDRAVNDYLFSFRAVRGVADYVAVNVSSPNTPGLRSLQDRQMIFELVSALVETAAEDDSPLPIFVKIAPDLTDQALAELFEAVINAGAQGLIATNTTLARTGIRGLDQRYARQAGGLSGAPLTMMARRVVARAVASGLPVIASGGIMNVGDAQAMFDLGARAVQLYTGFIYSGPGLVKAINRSVR